MTEERLIRIVGPRGTDEVNHAGVRYPIAPDGGFYVPQDALAPLLKTGGCVVQPRTQTEIVIDIARLVETLRPGRVRDLFSRAILDIFPDAPDDPPPSPLADDETPADDSEPAPNEPTASADDNPPAAEVREAPPVAPTFHRLVIPAIPSAVSLGRVPADG